MGNGNIDKIDDSMNLMEISIGRMLNLVKEQIEDELFHIPMMFIGKSGIGKTEAIMGLVKEMNKGRKPEERIGFKEFRLILTTEVDLMGTPNIEKDPDGSEWSSFATPRTMPSAEKDGEVGILLFDEITSATANVRTAAMQLMDKSRRLGNYKLPPKWLIICLGNGEGDGGNFNGMEFAFLNRCMAYRVKTEVDCTDPVKGLGWVQWAMQNKVNPSVVSFIKQYGIDVLHKFDTDLPASAFPSPRNWTSLATKLTVQEAKNGGKPLDDMSVTIFASGLVGKEMGSRFAIHYRFKDHLVDPKLILSGKVNFNEIFGEEKERSVVLMQLSSIVSFMIESLRENLEVFDPKNIIHETGQLGVSTQNREYLNNLIDLMMYLPTPEDSLYLFANICTSYGSLVVSALDSVPNYKRFKETNAFKYLGDLSKYVK